MAEYPRHRHYGHLRQQTPVSLQPMPYALFSAAAAPQPDWLRSIPQTPLNCPMGLEYLASVDQLLIKQKVALLETVTGIQTNNQYEILNTLGQRVFYALEDTNFCTRNCCGHYRPFDIKILANGNREVMHLSRELRCDSCLCPCCLQKVTVEAPTGHVLGYVSQEWSILTPVYNIQTANEETLLKVKGPICTWSLFGDVEFNISTADESSFCGRITKQWSGLAQEIFTDADNFGISFPLDLDVNVKAILLGAVFLIDFMYFENNTSKFDTKMKKN